MCEPSISLTAVTTTRVVSAPGKDQYTSEGHAEGVAEVREMLDRLAEEAPAVLASAFQRVQIAESDVAR